MIWRVEYAARNRDGLVTIIREPLLARSEHAPFEALLYRPCFRSSMYAGLCGVNNDFYGQPLSSLPCNDDGSMRRKKAYEISSDVTIPRRTFNPRVSAIMSSRLPSVAGLFSPSNIRSTYLESFSFCPSSVLRASPVALLRTFLCLCPRSHIITSPTMS